MAAAASDATLHAVADAAIAAGIEPGAVRQPLVHEQVRDFLVGGLRGDIGDVVAAVVEVVP
jgi:hypothetical protein